MLVLPIISIICCIAYIIFICYKFGIPVSLSETYYLLPNKLDWLFSAWCVMTSTPFCIYWVAISPKNIIWMPIVACISILMVGVCCRYKSIDKPATIVRGDLKSNTYTNKKWWKKLIEFIKTELHKLKPSVFLQYGLARPIHYICSLLSIVITTTWLCLVNPLSIYYTILFYPTFILIGIKIPGVYNKNYSTDVDNTSWTFFMEVLCFLQLFLFIWTKF